MTSLATPPSLAPEVALDLARLTDALRIAEGGFIGFALFDTFPARDAMIREIDMRLAGEVVIRRIELTPDQPYLHERLERPAEGERVAYFVSGLEGISAEARDQAFGALQIKREAIGRLDVPVILWMVEGNLLDLAKRAPDFFAWRAGLYDFRSPDRAPQRVEELGRAIAKMLREYSPSLIPPEELRKRIKTFEQLLAWRQAEPDAQPGVIAELHHDLGLLHAQLNEWDAALVHYQQAHEMREWLGDTAGVASTLIGIGGILDDKGEWDAALAHYQQARETYERLGDTAGVARTLNNIGNIFDNKGEWDAALVHYQQARETYERLGDTAGVAGTLWNIGLVYEKQRRMVDALSVMEQSIELERRLGHPDAEEGAAYLASLRQRLTGVASGPAKVSDRAES